jgi:hypothetical protein
LACIFIRKAIWKATATTLPNNFQSWEFPLRIYYSSVRIFYLTWVDKISIRDLQIQSMDGIQSLPRQWRAIINGRQLVPSLEGETMSRIMDRDAYLIQNSKAWIFRFPVGYYLRLIKIYGNYDNFYAGL